MQSALDEPVAGDVDGFRDEVRAAGCILYLEDNAGELVFDIPLLRAMPAGKSLIGSMAPLSSNTFRGSENAIS